MKKLLLAALGYFAYRKWRENKDPSATPVQPSAPGSRTTGVTEDRDTRF